jgi:hypothetical protein
MISNNKLILITLCFIGGINLSNAQHARQVNNVRPVGYYHKWMVVSSYSDGSDTLYYQDGKNGQQRMASWENSDAIYHPEANLIVDHLEKTMILIPAKLGSGKPEKPIAVPDSLWSFFQPDEDTSNVISHDSLLIINEDQAEVTIALDLEQNIAKRIFIRFKPQVNGAGNADDEELPTTTEWILIQRITNPQSIDSLVNLNKHIVRHGKIWKPTEAFQGYEFINLLNENTD